MQNNKGFTILELIIYIALISILMIGVSSLIMDYVLSSSNKPEIKETDYQLLIENFHA